MLILFLYDLPIVTLFTASGICLISFTLFVRRITQYPLLPYLSLARVKLRGLTDFSLVTGLAWSVGVCLVVLLLDLKFRAPAVAGILVYTALGLTILFVPESAVHGALERTRHDVLDEAIRRLKDPADPSSRPAWLKVIDQLPDPEKAFDRAVQEALGTSTWTYDLPIVDGRHLAVATDSASGEFCSLSIAVAGVDRLLARPAELMNAGVDAVQIMHSLLTSSWPVHVAAWQ